MKKIRVVLAALVAFAAGFLVGSVFSKAYAQPSEIEAEVRAGEPVQEIGEEAFEPAVFGKEEPELATAGGPEFTFAPLDVQEDPSAEEDFPAAVEVIVRKGESYAEAANRACNTPDAPLSNHSFDVDVDNSSRLFVYCVEQEHAAGEPEEEVAGSAGHRVRLSPDQLAALKEYDRARGQDRMVNAIAAGFLWGLKIGFALLIPALLLMVAIRVVRTRGTRFHRWVEQRFPKLDLKACSRILPGRTAIEPLPPVADPKVVDITAWKRPTNGDAGPPDAPLN